MRADKAEVTWADREKKNGWTVRIQVGAAVIKRHSGKFLGRDATEDRVRQMAITTAQDEGYDLDPGQVEIRRE